MSSERLKAMEQTVRYSRNLVVVEGKLNECLMTSKVLGNKTRKHVLEQLERGPEIPALFSDTRDDPMQKIPLRLSISQNSPQVRNHNAKP